MKRMIWLVIAALAVPTIADIDRFADLKSRLAEAPCVRLKFLSVLESDIFENVDTAQGSLVIDPNGRYRLNLNNDEYLFDGGNFWSYSRSNNQVVHEIVGADDMRVVSVSFLANLDRYYNSRPIVRGRKYELFRKSKQDDALPDSLAVSMRQDSLLLDKIEYRDINGELTRVLFNEQITDLMCADSLFLPDFPDTVEIIKM